jgi:putative membrane protein
MSEPDYTKPQRLSKPGLLLIFGKNLKDVIKGFWPLAGILILKKNIPDYIYLILLICLLLLIVYSVIAFLKFTFWFNDKEFVLQKGVFQKTVVNIPVGRITSVNTEQNALQQIFNVYTAKIETAGSELTEAKLWAVNQDIVVELQKLVLAGKTAPGEEGDIEAPDSGDSVIIRLNDLDLLKVGLSLNPLAGIAILTTVVYSVIDLLNDFFRERISETLDSAYNQVTGSNTLVILFLTFFILIVSISVNILRTVIRHYHFTMSRSIDGYRIEEGLLTRKRVLLKSRKVQMIESITNPVKRFFGLNTIWFRQFSDFENFRNSPVVIPGASDWKKADLLNEIFPGITADDYLYFKPVRGYWLRLCTRFGIIPFVPVFLAGFINPDFIIPAFIYLTLAIPACFVYAKKCTLAINSGRLIFGSGIVGLKQSYSEIIKIQSVTLRQSIWMKRKGVASIYFRFASDTLSIPYIPADQAKELMNYCLFRIESSDEKWM